MVGERCLVICCSGSFFFTTLVGTSDTFFLMFDMVAYIYTFCLVLELARFVLSWSRLGVIMILSALHCD